jgi:hypothetical protein
MTSEAMAAMAIVGVFVSSVGPRGRKVPEAWRFTDPHQARRTEMTDNVHWADVFGPNGSLKSYSMGRKKDGKWWIKKDELCVDRGQDDGGCYEEWLPGRMWNSEGQACQPLPKEFCSRPRRVIDLHGFGRLLGASISDLGRGGHLI